MAELHPTPTRLALLASIDRGAVFEDWYAEIEPGEIRVHEFGRRDRATAKVREMKAAGWCITDPAGEDLHVRRIVLTDIGRAVLEQNTGGTR